MTENTTDVTATATDTDDEPLHPEALEVGQQAYQQVVQAADAEAAKEGYSDRHEYFAARQDRARAYADAEAQLKTGIAMLSEQQKLRNEIPELQDPDHTKRFAQALRDKEGMTDEQIAQLSRKQLKDLHAKHAPAKRSGIPKRKGSNGQRNTSAQHDDDGPHGLFEISAIMYPEMPRDNLKPSGVRGSSSGMVSTDDPVTALYGSS